MYTTFFPYEENKNEMIYKNFIFKIYLFYDTIFLEKF